MSRHITRVLAAAAGIALTAPGFAVAGAAGTSRTGPAGPPAPSFVTQGRLYGAAATSARNVWAVGLVNARALIVHWDGTAWQQVPSPAPGLSPNLEGVAATSARNAWAVGKTSWDQLPIRTLILHWDGTAWQHVHSPTPTGTGILGGVAATSRRNAWAVGATGIPGGGHSKTLIERWNGKTWKHVPSPSPGRHSFRRRWIPPGNRRLHGGACGGLPGPPLRSPLLGGPAGRRR
jgi:hypothetical protein